MTIDLNVIAEVMARDAAQIRANIKQCGRHWGEAEVAKLERWAAAGDEAAAELRRPGVTNEDALAAITTMCRDIVKG